MQIENIIDMNKNIELWTISDFLNVINGLKNNIWNMIYNDIDVIWETRKFQKINSEQIGYEYRKSDNFFNISIPIKRSNKHVNLVSIMTFLSHPEIKCYNLCIGYMHENTYFNQVYPNEEYIYALGLYQINPNVDLSQFDITIEKKINDENHLNQSILLHCRQQSMKGSARIMKHNGFDPEYIHESRDDAKYRELQKESLSLILTGMKRYEDESEETIYKTE